MDAWDLYGASGCPHHRSVPVVRDGSSYCPECGRGLGTAAPAREWSWSDRMPGMVLAASTSHDGSFVVAGDEQGYVRAFTGRGDPLWEFRFRDFASGPWITGAAVAPDGRSAVVGCNDGRLTSFALDGSITWEMRTGARRPRIRYSPDGRAVLVMGETGGAFLIGQSGDRLFELPEAGRYSAVGPDLVLASIGGKDEEVALFNSSGSPLWRRPVAFLDSVAISSGGRRVCIANEDGDVRCLSPEGEEIWRFFVPNDHDSEEKSCGDYVHAVHVQDTPGGAFLGCEEQFDCSNGSVTMLDAEGRALWRRPLGISVFDVGVSPSRGLMMASGGAYSYLFSSSGRPVAQLHAAEGILEVAMSEGGNGMVVAGGNWLGYLDLSAL